MSKCTCGYAIGHPLVHECRCKKEEWVGLTEAEIKELKDLLEDEWISYEGFARAIEDKLKEKNT